MSQFNKVFNQLREKIEIGLIEKLTLFFVGKENPVLVDIPAKVDSGNDAYNVLHGEILEQDDNIVKFRTINNKILTMKKQGNIIIHIGSGNKEMRPIVNFDVVLGNKRYKNIQFSIADRSENDQPILISKDFVASINALINVKKEDVL